VTIYEPSLPISFHCPRCKASSKLLGGEAEKQTPPQLAPQFLSFRCPGCQTLLKAKIEQGHWLKNMTGQKSVYVLDRIEMG